MRSPLFSLQILFITLLLQPSLSFANQSSSIDEEIRLLINAHNLSGNAAKGVRVPSIGSPKSQLGMKLFYSTTLGGDGSTACVSCHHPVLGGGDGLSLPIGVGSTDPKIIGPNRQMQDNAKVTVPRNAPTTFNVALWKQHMFHDGRVKQIGDYSIMTPDVALDTADSLSGENLVQAQARFPITSMEEMRGNFLKDEMNQTLRRSISERLKKNWEKLFRVAFDDFDSDADVVITEQNMSEAIADYERSQLFVNNPWKSYVEGNKQAISEQAKRGAKLFFTPHKDGGAGCASCHSGDFFSNEQFYNTAMPQIGKGKHKHDGDTDMDDQGCYLVTKKPGDKYRFRTPSLLNVEMTGPWGHSGSYTSLEAVTHHMLNPVKAAKNYQQKQVTQRGIDFSKTPTNIKTLLNSKIDLSPMPNANRQHVEELVAFMKTLTDPCIKSRECLSPWIPGSDSNDPDGNMLHGLFKRGQRL
jgi:cytochrome c peroxidase